MEDLRSKFDAAMTNVIRARKACLESKEATIEAKEKLKDQEAGLINNGMVSGKNEKEREGSIRAQTMKWRDDLSNAEKSERIAILSLEIALDARRNLESILKIEEIGGA